MPGDSKAIHVPFPLPLYEALRLAAFQDRVSISEMVRRLCAAGVGERAKVAPALTPTPREKE